MTVYYAVALLAGEKERGGGGSRCEKRDGNEKREREGKKKKEEERGKKDRIRIERGGRRIG